MEFKCFYEWNQLPSSSETLFSQAAQKSLFLSNEWFENLATTALLFDQTLLIACVVKGDTVLAILPLIKCENKEIIALGHIYTSLYTVFLANENQDEILNCLAQGLTQLSFNCIKLGPVAADDRNIDKLEAALESSGLSCNRYAEFFNWYQPINKNEYFVDYMAARESRVRNTIARKERKLKRELGYEIRLHTGADVPQAMADFYTVYKASWKPDERFEEVIEGFIASFSKQSWIRLAILYIEDQPVAAQLWFVAHKKASIFKLAYDEAWRKYSPGSILTTYLMEYVIDTDKVEVIDFQRGNDRYKQEWMSERRQCWRLDFTRQIAPPKQEKSLFGWIKNKIALQKNI